MRAGERERNSKSLGLGVRGFRGEKGRVGTVMEVGSMGEFLGGGWKVCRFLKNGHIANPPPFSPFSFPSPFHLPYPSHSSIHPIP